MADFPWTEYDKIYLLVEIIKHGLPNTGSQSPLFSIINQHHRMQNPDWQHVVLPPGRTVDQCAHMYAQLRQQQPMQYSSYTPHPQTPTQPSAGASGPVNLKRPYETSFPPTRMIQPRPPVSGGAQYGLPPPERERPPKKKRGRPTKAEAQAKAEAQGSAGVAVAPLPGPSGRLPIGSAASLLPQPVEVRTTIYPTSGGSAFAESASRSLLPPTSRVPVHSLVTPTAPGSGSHSSSSSGKRRRGRSTRSNPDNQPEAEAEREAALARSPSERFAPAETQDTPARAAIIRHREEQEASPRQQTREPERRGAREQSSPHAQGPGQRS